MNQNNTTIASYQKTYVAPKFERGALFAFMQKRYPLREVLYPGCSVHITPAYYFPHVVFVDQSPTAAEFFSDQETLLELIGRHRRYPRSPYIRFIAQDFTTPLPVARNQYDLLLALFTGGVSQACQGYLKIGGYVLTNNHQNDAIAAARDQELSLVGSIRKSGKQYQFVEREKTEGLLRSRQDHRRSKRYLRQTSSGVEYIENEVYYLFKKVRTPG